jgi:hypothetical protein
VTRPETPHDVWQLAKRAVDAVPLNVDKMNELVGVSMVQDRQTPVRWEGGQSVLSPGLTLTGSVLGMKDTWSFAAIDIEPQPCVSLEEVTQHYPTATYGGAQNPDAPVLIAGWEVDYPWGKLGFGVRADDHCVVRIYLNPAAEPGR